MRVEARWGGRARRLEAAAGVELTWLAGRRAAASLPAPRAARVRLKGKTLRVRRVWARGHDGFVAHVGAAHIVVVRVGTTALLRQYRKQRLAVWG